MAKDFGGDTNTYRPSGDNESQLDREIEAALGDKSIEELIDAQDGVAAQKRQSDAATGLKRGQVVAVNLAKGDIFVDLGGRSQGVITTEHFEADKLPNVGDLIEVIIDHYDGSQGLLILTRKGAAQKAAWASLAKGDIVEARVTGVNKGGLECDLAGIRAFMPASQVDVVRIEDISTLIGQRLKCRITDLDRNDKNVVLSRRVILEEEAKEAREKTVSEIAEGQVRPGRVKTIMPYGAFVDIGGIDGLLHVSDMSHSRVADPNEVVKVGQNVTVKVLKIEKGGSRISLGMKQLEANPWDAAATKFKKGDNVKGKITSLQKFGAFVEVAPGVEALIPISEMTWKKRVMHPSEVVQVKQEVEVQVMDLDPVRRRMSVSLKAIEGDPWIGVERRYGVGAMVPGKVMRVVDFGAFVEIEPGVEGLVHISELSDKPIQRPSDAVRAGQDVQVRIQNVSESDRRISLSMKFGADEPAEAEAPAAAEVAPAAPKKPRNVKLRGGIE
jgi:small subunit ribosomal protein S1